MQWFLERLREASTWRGLVKLLGGLGLVMWTPETADQVAEHLFAVVGGLLALLGVLGILPDKAGAKVES